MRRFEATELRRFLTAVDQHLTNPVTIVLLGGSAMALYGVPGATTDIDACESNLSGIESALEQAREDTGLRIPVATAAVADAPFNYEDRLHPVQGGWKHLQVLLLEPHDLALSKTVRGYENDLDAIEKLHRTVELNLEILTERYFQEMKYAIKDLDALDQNFLAMVDYVFGDLEAERVEDDLKRRRGKAL